MPKWKIENGEIKMKKIFVVEDDESICQELVQILENEGYEAESLESFDNTKDDILKAAPNLVLMDINIPGINGRNLVKEIRKESDVPIIMVTSRTSEMDEVLSMSYGADDYITKPFYTKELLSRISANLRRSMFNAGNIYKKGDIVVDFDRYKISCQGDELNISTNEFDIVRILIENKGKVVRRDAIYEKIWDIHGNFVEYNTLTVAMSRIKAKLGTYGEKHQQYIETIRNVGYRWID